MALCLLKGNSMFKDTPLEQYWMPQIPAANAAPVVPLLDGERHLMAELIDQALTEAAFAPSTMRDEARAWLTEAPRFAARECFEALGVDYDAAIVKLQAKWATMDAAREARTQSRTARKLVDD